MAVLANIRILPRINRTLITVARGLSNLSIQSQSGQQYLPKNESTASCSFISNTWIYKQPNEVVNPLISGSISFPNKLWWTPPNTDAESLSIEVPAAGQVIEKQAARLIVIRRKKMKKHKLRKLRKRMKFERAKIRQKRELKKEKAFQAALIAQCEAADAFDAEKYVQERIDKLHEVIVPFYWKGKRMPRSIIREKMGLPPEPEIKS